MSKKILDFLQYADGKNNLESISKFINLPFKQTQKLYKILLKYDLINK